MCAATMCSLITAIALVALKITAGALTGSIASLSSATERICRYGLHGRYFIGVRYAAPPDSVPPLRLRQLIQRSTRRYSAGNWRWLLTRELAPHFSKSMELKTSIRRPHELREAPKASAEEAPEDSPSGQCAGGVACGIVQAGSLSELDQATAKLAVSAQ